MLTLRQFANKLKKEFRCNIPVKLRVCQMPYGDKKKKLRDFGDTQDKGTHYLIRINKDHELSIQKDTLMHEWAHCMAGWDDEHDTHSEEWGICYSSIYREMVGD